MQEKLWDVNCWCSEIESDWIPTIINWIPTTIWCSYNCYWCT
jgi:hypothetical protein